MFQKRFSRALTFTVIVTLVLAATSVFADDISNNLDVTPDVVAEVMPLSVGGADGTTDLYLIERNGDGKQGCNLIGSTTLVLAIASSDTSVATVSPSSVTFTSCGATKTLTVSAVATGSATISVSETSNGTTGTFNLAPATFTVNVTAPPPANTPPTLTITGVTGGASYNKGSVPLATCNVVDAEDGNSSFPATLSAITGPYASDGIGSQTASCSYTDEGGVTASASATYSIVDPTPPVIGYVLNPASADGSNGWYKSNVTLTWSVTENESPNSLLKTGCVDQNITADQSEVTYSCSATSAGGSAAQVDVKIKRDATAPNVAVTGFNVGDVFNLGDTLPTVDCSSSDSPSGIATTSGPTITAGGLTGNGVGSVTYTCTASDNAGNSASNSKSYSVYYTGLSGILQPINADNTSVFKRGQAVPVKFRLAGDGFSGFNTSSWTIQRQLLPCTVFEGDDATLENVGSNTPTSYFRYDASADQYIYNADMKALGVGTCWNFKVHLDSGQNLYSAVFMLTK